MCNNLEFKVYKHTKNSIQEIPYNNLFLTLKNGNHLKVGLQYQIMFECNFFISELIFHSILQFKSSKQIFRTKKF